MNGAKIAMNTKIAVMPAPTHTTVRAKRPASRHGLSHRSGRSRKRCLRAIIARSVSDPGVDIGIDDVDEQADEDDEDGEERDDALNTGVVSRIEVLHELAPETGPRERRLGEHRATQQSSELQSRDGHHRDEGVAERVPHHDAPLGNAARARGLDLTGLERLKQEDAD